jgi:hypothetical protein
MLFKYVLDALELSFAQDLFELHAQSLIAYCRAQSLILVKKFDQSFIFDMAFESKLLQLVLQVILYLAQGLILHRK